LFYVLQQLHLQLQQFPVPVGSPITPTRRCAPPLPPPALHPNRRSRREALQKVPQQMHGRVLVAAACVGVLVFNCHIAGR